MIRRARPILAVVAVAGLAVRFGAGARAQEPPRFVSSVDVTSIDVGVVDDKGQPVLNLQPGDFTVRIGGSSRRVVSAEWVPLKSAEGARPTAVPEGYTSNENASGGRLILIVVDQPNITFGAGARISAAIGGFLDRLEPTDRVAAVALGQGGMATPFTADRARIKQALARMGGRSGPTRTTSFYSVSVSEALDISNNVSFTETRVFDRECLGYTGADLDRCKNEILSLAMSIANDAEANAAQTIGSLRAMLDGLKGIDAPKTIVFVSEGFIARDRAPITELGAMAAAARSSIYVLKLDNSGFESAETSGSGGAMALFNDREVRGEGLEALATASRGSLFNVTGSGVAAFERIEAELSGYYLLGVESEAADKDGRPHPLKVDVARRGVTVRSRQGVMTPVATAHAQTPRETMMAALNSPLLLPALPIRIVTFSLREPGTSKIQLLVHADVGTDYAVAKGVSVAYVIADGNGRIVDSHIADARLLPVMTGVPSPLQFTGGASLEPGDYTLKFAVVEGDRVGSVEHPVHAALVDGGAVSLSELVVGGPSDDSNLARPTVGSRVSFGTVQGYFEAYAPNASTLKAKYEVAATPDGEPLIDAEAQSRAAGPERIIFSSGLPVRQLPPGKYYLRATVSGSAGVVKTLARSFEVVPPAVLMTSAAGTGLVATAPSEIYLPVGDEMLSRPFHREDAVRPDVLRLFRGTLSPEAMTLFDEGVGLLSRASYPSAEETFKRVIGDGSESTAALVYLAATYAASGHDLEAAGAWQTSLIDGSNIPQIYEWLGDALLRNRQLSEARAVLEEAVGKWPSDDRFALPLALVYGTFGQGREAVLALERHLSSHADDHPAQAMGVEWLYHLHAAGASAHTPPEDVKRARAWAEAYTKAKGPQSALVKQWTESLEGGP